MILESEEYNTNLNFDSYIKIPIFPIEKATELVLNIGKAAGIKYCYNQLDLSQKPNWLQTRIDYYLDVINELKKI